MTQPRSAQVSVSDTPWYHCVSRCVRRAFLCGADPVTGMSYEYRRGWIAARIQKLASVFAIDVAGYAVISNHFYVVVRIDAERAAAWTPRRGAGALDYAVCRPTAGAALPGRGLPGPG